MAISFNSVPATQRVPWSYIEFDNSNAVQGPTLKAYRALLLAQKLSSGTATANVPVRVTSAALAKTLFGAGSMLAHMFEFWFASNPSTEVWAIPLADNGSGVAASGTLAFTGPSTAAGAVNLYVGGRKLSVAVASGQTATQIGDAVAAAVEAESDYPVSAAAVTGTVTLTFKHKGLVGNEVDVRLNYYEGEALPAGVGCVVTAMASGTLNPVLTSAISAMAEVQYDVIACPFVDAVSLPVLETEMASRWGPLRQIDGVVIGASNRGHSDLGTLGDSRNTQHVSIVGCYKHPTAPHEVAASAAGAVAFSGNIDPARPFQTLELPGVLPPAQDEQFTNSERNLLLFDGISTVYADAGGKVRIERMITTYKTSALGAADVSYLDLTSVLTLSYLRYDFRNTILRKYPRHKLANDGTRFGAGQAVMTPKVGKAEAINMFRNWEELGLVEGFDQFKNDLIVERNISDANRLDFYLAPDLINGLIVTGVKIGFLL